MANKLIKKFTKKDPAEKIAQQIIDCFSIGGKVIIFGNGGSLADASHFAAEFNSIGSVIALDNAAKITAIANDYGFDRIFSMQVTDIAEVQDLVIGISSSGESNNVIYALRTASELVIDSIDFPREGKTTQEVQNYQYQLLHRIYQIVDKDL
jgi:phosphoheptose isomerase